MPLTGLSTGDHIAGQDEALVRSCERTPRWGYQYHSHSRDQDSDLHGSGALGGTRTPNLTASTSYRYLGGLRRTGPDLRSSLSAVLIGSRSIRCSCALDVPCACPRR